LNTRRRLCVGIGLALLALATSLRAADAARPSNGETKVTRGGYGGEPEIAIDRVHKTIVVVFKTYANHACGLSLSADGGRTWKTGAASPPGDDFRTCADPAAAAALDGTLYVATEYYNVRDEPNTFIVWNAFVRRSTDGGRTWSPPVYATGDRDISKNFALGRNLGHMDRPFITVDDTTGTVYVTVTDFERLQRWVVASHDRGRTFGAPHAIDSADYPEVEGQPNADYIPSAAGGTLAFAYVASAAPGRVCPCSIFETSRTDGAVWNRYVTPLAANWVAADPSRRGRFAIMSGTGFTAKSSDPNVVRVSSTSDYGRTWTAPVAIGQKPSNPRTKPWIAFGPTGTLGVAYKTQYPNGSPDPDPAFGNYPFDYWAAISHNGGRTFGTPLRVSGAPSPPEDLQGGDGVGSDDFSSVALDDDYLYAAWADMRKSPSDASNGGLSVYFRRIPLRSFR